MLDGPTGLQRLIVGYRVARTRQKQNKQENLTMKQRVNQRQCFETGEVLGNIRILKICDLSRIYGLILGVSGRSRLPGVRGTSGQGKDEEIFSGVE